MPFKQRKVNDYGNRDIYTSGKILFQYWLDDGSLVRASNNYTKKYSDDPIIHPSVAAYRIRKWAIEHIDESMIMMKKASPMATDDMIHETLITWATRTYSWSRFQKWTEQNPWAKDFEAEYRRYYNAD